MSREFKHYDLRKANKPIPGVGLASTVAVLDEAGRSGFCYVRFSKSFVLAVGKKLPRGVSADDPAYLLVCFRQATNDWEVSARYLSGEASAVLWRTDKRPSWLKTQLESDDGTGTKASSGTRSRRTGSNKRSGTQTRGSGERATAVQAQA